MAAAATAAAPDSATAAAAASAAADALVHTSRLPLSAPPSPVAAPPLPAASGGGAAGSAAAAAPRPAFVEVRRLDLIRVVRGRIAAEAAAGASSFGSSASSLSAWDVHLLDPSADGARLAGFVLRRGCILLAMSPLRVVLTSHAFFLCPEPGCDGELEPLIRRLGDPAVIAASAAPLPVLALAAILDVCRTSMAADLRALMATMAQLSVKLRHRRGAEEVMQHRMASVEAELAEYLERLASVLRAVASFSDAEARHYAEAKAESRLLLHDVHA